MDWSKGTYSYEAMLFPINLLGFLFPVKFPQIQWCKQRRSNKIHLPRHMTHMTLTEQTLGDCRTTSPGEFSTRDWLLFKYHLFFGGVMTIYETASVNLSGNQQSCPFKTTFILWIHAVVANEETTDVDRAWQVNMPLPSSRSDSWQTSRSLLQFMPTVVNPRCEPWCWNIYLHLPQKSPSFVGKYTIHGAFGNV